MKILLFIDEDRIDSFFSLIKGKYYKLIKNFFDYFEDRQWNYSSFLKNYDDIKKNIILLTIYANL